MNRKEEIEKEVLDFIGEEKEKHLMTCWYCGRKFYCTGQAGDCEKNISKGVCTCPICYARRFKEEPEKLFSETPRGFLKVCWNIKGRRLKLLYTLLKLEGKKNGKGIN